MKMLQNSTKHDNRNNQLRKYPRHERDEHHNPIIDLSMSLTKVLNVHLILQIVTKYDYYY